jgi:hypothetical protein
VTTKESAHLTKGETKRNKKRQRSFPPSSIYKDHPAFNEPLLSQNLQNLVTKNPGMRVRLTIQSLLMKQSIPCPLIPTTE